jgi:hypothetical protein
MASHQVVTIDTLPPELLRQIFGVVGGPAPSDHRLNEQPDGDMLRSPNCSLKATALVSKRWCAIVSPILFRNVVWALERCDDLLAAKPDADSDLVGHIPILAFLRANDLSRHVRSFTIIVCQRVAPEVSPKPLPGSEFYEPQARQARWLDLITASEQDNNWLWNMLFSLMDPLKLTIIASPQTLRRLLSCAVRVGDEKFFSDREYLQILSLSRDSKSTTTSPQRYKAPPPDPEWPPSHCCLGEENHIIPTSLFTIRPWTHVLLNENSWIRAYRYDHYMHRDQPSILPSLVRCGSTWDGIPMVPATVTSLSYIAVFPRTSHFNNLIYTDLPHIEHLYVQLAPRNDILVDEQEMDGVEESDLWREHTCCYLYAMGMLQWRYDFAGVFVDDFMVD